MEIVGMVLFFIALCGFVWIANEISLRVYEKLAITTPNWALTARISAFIISFIVLSAVLTAIVIIFLILIYV